MGQWNKKGSLKKIPMVVATMSRLKRAYPRLCPENDEKKNSGSKGLRCQDMTQVLSYSNEQNWLKSGQKKLIDDQLVVLNNLIA